MNSVLIIGATSAIAQSTAKLYADNNCKLYLLARDNEKLKIISDDLNTRGAKAVQFALLDMNDLEQHERVIQAVSDFLGHIDLALLAYGTLPDQSLCEENPSHLQHALQTNANSTIVFISQLARIFETQKDGTLAIITSVAGDRGRQSNYVYGAAKAAVSTYLSGLRNSLYQSGVNVLDIRPGFVDTPMTAQFKKGLLWAQPETIANGIVKAVQKRKSVVYLPFFWRPVMWLICRIPEPIFKRLSL